MGICISKSNVYPSTQEEKETNMMINKQIQEEAKIKEKNDNSTYKVLLLGPADSGKVKQNNIKNNIRHSFLFLFITLTITQHLLQ